MDFIREMVRGTALLRHNPSISKPFSRPMELARPSQRAIESGFGPGPFAVSAATDGDIY